MRVSVHVNAFPLVDESLPLESGDLTEIGNGDDRLRLQFCRVG